MCKQQNSTQENKCIRTVGEYIDAIQEIIKKEREKDSDFDKKYEVYFRGHLDKDFFLIPNLLRNKPGDKDSVGQAYKEIVDNEHIAFRSLVAKHPSEFAECKSAIEHLVKMQHYKLKTRLLDITSNALVALYFACTTESGDANDKLGEVIVFKLPKRMIKRYDSDTISAVANIARCDINKLRIKLGNNDLSNEFVKSLDIEPQINEIRTALVKADPSGDSLVSLEYKKQFNDDLGYLHHQIKAEKSYYNPLIEPHDLGKIWAVNTKLENPRIINQSGSFLLFGLGINEEEIDGSNQLTYTKKFHPQIPDAWIAGRVGVDCREAHTQADSKDDKKEDATTTLKKEEEKKANIVQQLSMLGIDHSFIFPDLETAAKEINKQLLSSKTDK